MNYSDGTGFMTVYEVFPGVQLIYNDFDTESCFCGMHTCNDILEINHCREGRSECELQNGLYRYIGEGDLSINVLSNHAIKMGFPLKHYRGITIKLYLSEVSYTIPKIIEDTTTDIYKFKEKFCKNKECFIMRASDKIEHIFSELYSVPESVQKPYFILKILELLLFLNVIDASKSREQREYYFKY